jgi:hypothetical protein
MGRVHGSSSVVNGNSKGQVPVSGSSRHNGRNTSGSRLFNRSLRLGEADQAHSCGHPTCTIVAVIDQQRSRIRDTYKTSEAWPPMSRNAESATISL